MKKKKPTANLPADAPIVAPEILEQAKIAADTDKLAMRAKCVVCGGETSANSSEQLCWVCRRLKISAWRDSDLQMGAQE
ncbi:MAG: hypothetical protein R2729_29905 [Bryobacteraceae bacterium]